MFTKYEYETFKELALNSGKVLKYEDLWNMVWGYSNEADRDTIHRLVSRLRSKIEACGSRQYIFAMPGVGYVLRNPQ